jgi:hypothetical protein
MARSLRLFKSFYRYARSTAALVLSLCSFKRYQRFERVQRSWTIERLERFERLHGLADFILDASILGPQVEEPDRGCVASQGGIDHLWMFMEPDSH